MKHNIIKTDNYLLVVDDSEIKVGDWYYLPRTNSVYECKEDPTELNLERRVGVSNVIAHHPLNGAPHLDGVDLLPSLEDENELLEIDYLERLEERRNIALNFKGQVAGRHPDNFTKSEMYHMSRGYVEGYQDARKKYQFTEEDLRRAFNAGDNFRYYENAGFKSIPSNVLDEDEYIKSLQHQHKLPIAFECELLDTQFRDINTHELIKGRKKTITNSEGKTEWVGKWIWE